MRGQYKYFTGYAVQTPEAPSQTYIPGGEGGRIAQVQPQYHELLSGEPQFPGDDLYIPVPLAYEPQCKSRADFRCVLQPFRIRGVNHRASPSPE